MFVMAMFPSFGFYPECPVTRSARNRTYDGVDIEGFVGQVFPRFQKEE